VARARLTYAIAIDAMLHAEGSLDPVVYVYGGRRGAARPFLVRRGYQGPQGAYVEEFRVVDSRTRLTVYRSDSRILELAGEHYTTDCEDRVDVMQIELGEYELVFTVDGEVIPGVPLFVEPGPGSSGGEAAYVPTIVDEATKKSDLVWVEVPGGRARGVWHLWHKGAAYVVFGGQEQEIPGLADTDSVLVTVRSKDKGGTVVSWRGAVELVPPGSPAWDEVTPLLVGKRLNNRDGDAAPARWAKESLVARFVPTGELVEEPGHVRRDRRAEEPAPSPARTETRIPITFHRVRRTRTGS
jgi:hypothetical protein